jgi:hypothetical protein
MGYRSEWPNRWFLSNCRCFSLELFVALTAGAAIGARLHGPDARRVAAQRIEFPIKQTLPTDGAIRYSVPVEIGNASAINAMLAARPGAPVPELAYSVSGQTSI